MDSTALHRALRIAALAFGLPAIAGCPAAPESPTLEEWDAKLRGKKLIHVREDDATRRGRLWLCADGSAVGRWDTPVDDERGPESGDDLAMWTLQEDEGSVCMSMAFEEEGLLLDSPCVVIRPDGDGFWLEDRRWVVSGDAGC